MRPTIRTLGLTALFLALGGAAAAQDKRDPRPLRGATSEQPDHGRFLGAYVRAGEPVFLVLCGVGQTGQTLQTGVKDLAIFDPSGDSDLLRAELERHLLAVRAEVADPRTLTAKRQRELEILALQGESSALELLSRDLSVDVQVLVWMLPTSRLDARWRVTVEMLEVHRGRKIGAFAFDWREGTDAATVKRYAGAMARKLFDDFAAWYVPSVEAGPERRYTLRLLGVSTVAEVLRARVAFGDIPGVSRIRDRGFARLGSQSVATLRVDYAGRPFDLMAELQVAAESELGMLAEITDGAAGQITLKALPPRPVVAATAPAAAPKPALGEDLRARFQREYVQEGRPRIAVLINRDLTTEDARDPELSHRIEPHEVPAPDERRASSVHHDAETAVVVNLNMGPTTAPAQPAPTPEPRAERAPEGPSPLLADGRRMEDYLYKRFVNQLQVSMVDPGFARDRLHSELDIDRDVLTEKELAFMLGRVAGVDVVIQGIGRVDRTEEGHTLGYTFRAVRVTDGVTLAADGWAETIPPGDERLMDERMGAIADRIVAQLAEQMVVSWSPPRSLSVMLTNARTQKDVFVVMSALEHHIDEIQEATFERHVAEESGIGMFTIRYESSYEDLIQQVLEQELRLNIDLDASNTTRETLTIRIKDELTR